MNVLFRKSSSMAATPSKQALSALLFFESSNFSSSLPIRESLFPRSRPLSGDLPAVDCSWALERTGFSIRCREFHLSAGALGFRASDIARAEYAVADFSDEEMAPGKKYSGNVDDEGLEISKLGISHEIVSALSKKGITKLFPIQKAVLEPAMQGRDMIGRARTGTGKTLAFGIPIMDRIIQFNAKHGRGRNPLALVMAPTRELARQVEKEFSESSSLDTICVYGGVPISSQMRTLNYGVDVVVGTPGRIMDLFNRGALNLSEVQFIVLDEADQMFDVGFGKDVEAILDSLPQKRQTMMFSATMPSWIQNLTRKHMKDPVTIDLVGDSDQKLADGIALYSIASDSYGKSSILGPLITEHARGGKCIVFTQTKRDADRLAYSMNRSLRCEALHGDISQNQRERTLSGFRDGLFNVLIATDVAARGLDIPNVDLVIHYELPNTSEIFVHRSGRTGRAGKKGSAILIYTEQQTRAVRGIEQDVGCKFKELPRITVEGGTQDMSHDMNGGRFGSFGGGRSRTSDFGSSGGSQFGRFGDFGGSSSSRFGSFGGSSSSRPGGFGDSSPGRSGGFGGSGFSRSGGFGDNGSGRSGGFGDNGSGRSGGFGDSGSSRFGGYGSGHSSRFGDSNLSRSSGFGDSVSSHSGSFGQYGSERSSSYGDSSSSHSSGFNDFGPSHFGGPRSKHAGGFDGFGNDGVDE